MGASGLGDLGVWAGPRRVRLPSGLRDLPAAPTADAAPCAGARGRLERVLPRVRTSFGELKHVKTC